MPEDSKQTITRIESVGKRRPGLRVWLDDHEWATLDGETVIRAKLRLHQTMAAAELEKILSLDESLKARQSAAGFASRSPRSRRELEDYLDRRGFSATARGRAIEMLDSTGTINDEKVVERIIRTRRKSKYGPRRIQAELLARGIAPDLVRSGLAESANHSDPASECIDLIQRRVSRFKSEDRETREKKLTEFLFRRGYEYQSVNQAMSLYREEEESGQAG
jgi:regulatory protein